VDDHSIARAQQLIERHHMDAMRVGGREGIAGDHPRGKAGELARGHAPDAP
jgi:hypothetical protein